jgi:DNA-binding NarL/FixJ family response regulator
MTTTARRKRQTKQTQRPRLVVADDDPFVRSMLPAQLEAAFDCVGAAADADAAIAMVVLERPDVAILDVDMPGGGAKRATREIRIQAPETAVVVLSGDEERSGVIDLLEAGAIAYLRKGVDPRDLSDLLKTSISAHRHAIEAGEARTA